MNKPKVKLLVVDDDAAIAKMLRRMLECSQTTQYLVDTADTYDEAMALLARNPYDICLVDLKLDNNRNGMEIVRSDNLFNGPYIILTGTDDLKTEHMAIHAGAADYLVKGSFDPDLLDRVIRHALERHRVSAELTEERRRLRILIDHLPDLIYFKDIASRFVISNPAHLRFIGAASHEEVAGRTDHDVFPRELADQYLDDEKRVIATGQPMIGKEERCIDKDGNTHWMLATKVPYHSADGNVLGIVGISHDITALKQVEDELRRARDELEERVARRTAELSKAVTALQAEVARRISTEQQLRKAILELEHHSQEKSEFVANVSHELKTPITSIMYGTRNLLKGIAGPLPVQATRYLKMFDSECDRLVNTINHILDLSKLDNRVLSINAITVPLQRLIARTLEPLHFQADAARVVIETHVAPGAEFVRCDPAMLQRVLQNVIANAIKFTPAGGRIALRVTIPEADPGLVAIVITDTGIGIPPDAIGRITERYFRVGTHVSGTGLGLAISKEIMLLHGGSLSLVSPPPSQPNGTEVTLTLPLAAPPFILVANNNLALQALIQAQLTASGYIVDTVSSGHELLSRAHQTPPNLIIADLLLDDMHGYDLIIQIKEAPDIRHVPIIATTGPVLDETTADILERFTVPTLRKPWQIEELTATVDTALIGMNLFQPTTREEAS